MSRQVVVLGGTSGIGLALARHCLAQGDDVTVCGRDAQRLPAALQATQPRWRVCSLDVADKAALAAVIHPPGGEPLDLLIVTAGMYFNTRHQAVDAATTLRMLQTNVSGLSQAFELGAQRMLAQGSGHLVAVSSMAGLMKDYPGASVYSATKRTVLSVCHTYQLALAPFGIAVTAVVPGYIDTARLRQLNGGDARRKPFLLSEAQAVDRILAAIARRQALCVFPRRLHGVVRLLNALPAWCLRGLLGRP
ncbi:MAG: SDR family NAD(P)-dependent oxidoreductase [Pseudomonadota bacterium]